MNVMIASLKKQRETPTIPFFWIEVKSLNSVGVFYQTNRAQFFMASYLPAVLLVMININDPER